MRSLKTALLVAAGTLLLLANSAILAQDSLNISMTGRIVYWDSPYGTAISGNYLYVADGYSGLQVLDVSNPSQPQQVATVDLSDFAFSVVIDSNFAYVAETEFAVIDINDPEHPRQVGFINYQSLGHSVRGLTVHGNYVYVAGYEDLSIIDVSVPTNPIVVGNQYIGMSEVYSLMVLGDYLYVAGSYGFKVFNIADPINPAQTYSNYSIGAQGMAIDGLRLFLANANEGLYILSLQNPAQPTLIQQLTHWYCNDIALSGDTAYIAAGPSGFKILNLSNLSNPQLLGSWDDGNGYGWRITADQNRVYLSSYNWYIHNYFSGIGIIDVSDPTDPVKLGNYHSWGECRGVAVDGNHTFLANGLGGLVTVDVSNPFLPLEVGHLSLLGSANQLILDDQDLYVLAVNRTGSRLYSVDASDPIQPEVSDVVIITNKAYNFAISGDYAYLPCYLTGTAASLKIYNIADPCSLYFYGSCSLQGYLSGIDISGSYAYIVFNTNAGSHGFYVVNVSNPANPTLVTTFTISGVGSLGQIVISGSYAYLPTNNPEVIKIVNILNPTAPYLAASFTDNFYPGCIAIADNYAYISSGSLGIRMYSMPTPTTFTLLGYHDTPGNAGLCMINNEHIYLADQYSFLILTTLVSDFMPVQNDESSVTPSSYSLNPVFPNPFNATTTLNYDLPVASQVKLQIYDTSGRLITTLSNGYRPAGSHQVTWNAAGQPSGIYFCRLQAGEYTAVQKIVLLK